MKRHLDVYFEAKPVLRFAMTVIEKIVHIIDIFEFQLFGHFLGCRGRYGGTIAIAMHSCLTILAVRSYPKPKHATFLSLG
ncbi:MAG: hypothetical protein ABSA18_11865 [Dehalococcoidia bacterium]